MVMDEVRLMADPAPSFAGGRCPILGLYLQSSVFE